MKWSTNLKKIPVIGDIFRIFALAYSLIHALALTAEQIGGAVESYIPHTIMNHCRHLSQTLKKVEQDFDAQRKQKQHQKIFNKELQKVLALHMPIFKGHIFNIVILCMVIGLQMISVNTTYSGAEYYMKDLKEWIPIVFTSILQGTVILLSTTTFNSGKKERQRVAALMIAVILSISISYVGIINGIINPLTASNTEKNNYMITFNHVKESVSRDEQRTLSPDVAAAKILGEVENIFNMCTAIQNIAEEWNNLADETQSDTTTGTITSGSGDDRQIDSYIETSTRHTYSPEDRERIRTNASQLAGYTQQINDSYSNFSNFLDLWNRSLATGEMSPVLIELDAHYKTMTESGKSSYQLVHGKEMGGTYPSIADAFKRASRYQTLANMEPISETFAAKEADDILSAEVSMTESASSSAVHMILGNLLTYEGSTTRKYAENIRALQNEATNSFQQISPLLNDEELANLTEAYDALMVTKDANYIAFSYLSPQSPNFTSAVIAMIIALIIDGGTLGLSLLKNYSESSPLYARTSADFYEEETDLLETIFLSIPQSSGLQITAANCDFDHYCAVYMDQIISIIGRYLKQFHISNCTIQKGFGAVAKEEDLSDNSFIPITSILTKLNYIVVLSAWEYHQLEKAYNGVQTHPPRVTEGHLREKRVYLLRSKAEIYLRQNIAQSNLFHTMLNGYKNNGGTT